MIEAAATPMSMTSPSVDLEKLRAKLRCMDRGLLLILVERAIELVPRSKLRALVGDCVDLSEIVSTSGGSPSSLLEEVRRFHAASLRGDYYEDFFVTSKNYMEKSRGTEAFMAEFDRLLKRCVREAERGPRAPIRESFDLLFALLRRIMDGHDDVVFFADDGGVWEFGIDWCQTLSAYFRCLAEMALPDVFAQEVKRSIHDFAPRYGERLLTEATRYASAAQKVALRGLSLPAT